RRSDDRSVLARDGFVIDGVDAHSPKHRTGLERQREPAQIARADHVQQPLSALVGSAHIAGLGGRWHRSRTHASWLLLSCRSRKPMSLRQDGYSMVGAFVLAAVGAVKSM